jgi:hypothetical protein
MSLAERADLTFWAPKRRSLSYWLLFLLNAVSAITVTLGMWDFLQAGAAKKTSGLIFYGIDLKILLFVAFALFLLQSSLWWAVTQIYSRKAGIKGRVFAIVLYLFCLVITAGSAFGFWWKIIYGNSETLSSAQTSVEATRISLTNGLGRLQSLKLRLGQLQDYSERQMNNEELHGNSCGKTEAKIGQRYRLRKGDAERFKAIGSYVDSKISTTAIQINEIIGDLEKLEKNDPATISPVSGDSSFFIESLNTKQNVAIQNFNNFKKDPILAKDIENLKRRAEQTEFSEGNYKFICPDAQLSEQLNLVAQAIGELPTLESSKITISQGSNAVVQAVGRLANTLYAVAFDCRFFFKPCTLPQSAAKIREQLRTQVGTGTKNLTEQNAGIDRNEILPLALGGIIDIAILGIGFFRYRKDLVPVNTKEFIEVLNDAFLEAFNRRPTAPDRSMPLKAVVFDHWSGHYGVVPVDYSGYVSVKRRDRTRAPWARRSDDSGLLRTESGNQSQQKPTFEESQYVDAAFMAFVNYGLAKPISFFGRLFVSDSRAKAILSERNSIFANAPSVDLYKFYPNAWTVVRMHLLDGGAETVSPRVGLDRADEDDYGTRQGRVADPLSHFPKGFNSEI